MKIVMILISLFYSVFFNSMAQAALADIYDAGTPGYHMVYDGRMAGFGLGELSGVPILYMSTDPTIYAPVPAGTAVNVYTYQDIQNGASGLKWTAAQYGEMAYLMQSYPAMYLPDSNFPASEKSLVAVNLNIAIWNIAVPGSIPFPDASSPIYDGGYAQLYYNHALGFSNFDWTHLGMQIVSIPGGDEFFSDKAVAPTMATPVPPAAWLFASGLIGMVGVARRKVLAPR